MSPTSEYVSSKQGIKLLGTNQGQFFYYVSKGDIEREPGSPPRKSRYKVASILKVKSKLNRKRGGGEVLTGAELEKAPLYIDWMENMSDVLTSLKLDYQVYGDDVELEGLSYYAERVKKNPRVALAVYDSPKRENILAYISLLPVAEEIILDVLSGRRHETTIATEDIETYDRKGGYTLLAESVVCHPEHTYKFMPLINHYMNYWCEQYPDRYITRVYAQAASKQGDILIHKLFFSPLYHLAKNAFMLDLERPGASRIIQRFQDCLQQKGWQMPEII